MRISAESNDPGYNAYVELQWGGKVPFGILDGVEQRGVITADEEAGLIVRIVRDEAGQIVARDGQIVTETVHGVVRIELREATP